MDGLPLYDPTATSVVPYAYWYPPVFAQVLVPVALVLPSLWFTAAWTLLMLVCLWWLAGRNVLVALALVAFPPVAVELWFRNIHLVLAVLLVVAVRRPPLFPVAAAIKLAPGSASTRWRPGRYRDACLSVGVGGRARGQHRVLARGMGGLGAVATPGDQGMRREPAGTIPRPRGGRAGLASQPEGCPAAGGRYCSSSRRHRASHVLDDRVQPACGDRAALMGLGGRRYSGGIP